MVRYIFVRKNPLIIVILFDIVILSFIIVILFENVERYFSNRFIRVFIDSCVFRTLLSCDRHMYSKGVVLTHNVNA